MLIIDFVGGFKLNFVEGFELGVVKSGLAAVVVNPRCRYLITSEKVP
jgi:hypothetical protein